MLGFWVPVSWRSSDGGIDPGSASFANPKSSTFATPSRVIFTLAEHLSGRRRLLLPDVRVYPPSAARRSWKTRYEKRKPDCQRRKRCESQEPAKRNWRSISLACALGTEGRAGDPGYPTF